MEKINYRFLNYKRYNKFLDDLRDNKVREDAIVFVQDELHPCIWARGKEYVCEGPFLSTLDEIDGFVLRNGSELLLLLILPGSTGIRLLDSRGVVIDYAYASAEALENFKSAATKGIKALQDSKANLTDLDNLASNYETLLESLRGKQKNLTAGNGIAIDENSVISVDQSILESYETILDHTNDLKNKQDKLTAGDGIQIEDNVISTKIDTDLYILVTELPDPEEADEDKIYILEISDGENNYTYTLYRIKSGQWVPIGSAIPTVDLKGYLKEEDAKDLYQPKSEDYVVKTDLAEYTPLSRTVAIEELLPGFVVYEYLKNYQRFGDYPEKEWVERYFVKKTDLYTPEELDDIVIGPVEPVINPDDGTVTVPTTTIAIEVDSLLDEASSNPVENRVVTNALKLKANKSELLNYVTKESIKNKIGVEVLNDYATKEDLVAGLRTKQNTLTPRHGIQIINDEISSTLDVDVFIIVDDLLEITTPNTNKIYLVERLVEGQITYIEYRYINGNWVEMGPRNPGIDLVEYIKERDADNKYQLQGDYLTKSEAASIYQTIDDYATDEQIELLIQSLSGYATNELLEALRLNINNTYQRKGGYVLAQDVSNALTVLQQIIDLKYVLKKDVYNPNLITGWSTGEPTQITVGSSTGGSSSGGVNVLSNMVTLTTLQYLLLVDNNLVDENTYYFTYEGEEITNWTFGGTFPITFSESNGVGTFPITLT